MRLLDRLAGRNQSGSAARYSIDDYISLVNEFTYQGATYPAGLNTLWRPSSREDIASDFAGYMSAVKGCPPAFAAQLARAQLLSEITFTFRNNRRSQTPGRTFGTRALETLEQPWPNATTGELIAKMEWHEGLAGNAYVRRDRTRKRLQVLRPDWVTILMASESLPDEASVALDCEVVGYLYTPGGAMSRNDPVTIFPEDMVHWSPLPDPEATYRGMSWITPAVREIQGDRLATEHKLKFFELGATPNLVVKGVKAPTEEQFKEIVARIENRHQGFRNAYRTLVLGEGADATVVGSNLEQLAFKETQGAGETRIAQLSRVPAVVLQISEGLQGSSLNTGNFGAARRQFADGWLRPTWRSLSAALAKVVDVPSDADLWFDPSDVPFLREDEADLANIRAQDAQTIRNLVDAGYEPDAAIAFVQTGDHSHLTGRHSGLYSVQLQAPGSVNSQPAAPAADA